MFNLMFWCLGESEKTVYVVLVVLMVIAQSSDHFSSRFKQLCSLTWAVPISLSVAMIARSSA